MKYIVLARPQPVPPDAVFAMHGSGKSDALMRRREQLRDLFHSAVDAAPATFGFAGMPAGASPVRPDAVKFLDGVGAMIVDDADVDPARFAGLAVDVVENYEVHLPDPEIAAEAQDDGAAWHLDVIGLTPAHGDARGVLVGLLDTGIDASHPEFEGKTIHFAEFDADGRRIAGLPRDAHRHGTHVAATVAGKRVGVARAADIAMAAVLTGTNGRGTLAQVLSGLDWLITQEFRPETDPGVPGVDLINASLGGRGFNVEMRLPVQNARALGIVTIAAAGNDGKLGHGHHGWPGNFPEAVGVGATDRDDIVAEFSAWGERPPPEGPVYEVPRLSAPGVAIYSALPGNDYGAMSGTSMAAPIVCGVAALRIAADPTLRERPADLVESLLASVAQCQDHPRGNRGGRGRVKA